jgi:hypothetical protein
MVMVVRHDELAREVPSGLIGQQQCMTSWGHVGGDRREMQVHPSRYCTTAGSDDPPANHLMHGGDRTVLDHRRQRGTMFVDEGMDVVKHTVGEPIVPDELPDDCRAWPSGG